MNQKNSLGIDLCFKDLDNPIDLFENGLMKLKKLKLMIQMLLALATVERMEYHL